ncbi:hypothetical protein CONPUDRAFT_136420 [Coniophora puteana RWD-64-598 SS2]|uniref:Peptidase S1 domain-containing protein n=1 Tax=Coniophora puteana (strain RWD-64-598) TaxID=741705 RepID=A0A5M3MW46_CONPW|nr:uncharacterized protein CONPUDRAFT_136420 [Coniophora puteana RWD-64-598 SS2]EIW83378.1 hypothetical protein CONPUDRAFT_136420 [Coniophora puteana RWD-64-598 SS2]
MTKGGSSNELLLITTRHVALPTDNRDVMFEHEDESEPHSNILLLGDEAYDDCLASIQGAIEAREMKAERWELHLKMAEGRGDKVADAECKAAERKIEAAKEAKEELCTFYNDVGKHWATSASRVLGHVIYSPPMRLGAGIADEGYTEDYAIVKVDTDKIDRTQFKGNMIDLGTDSTIGVWEFTKKMRSNDDTPSFEYPFDRLLTLQGTISDEEMRQQTPVDKDKKSCLMVIKDGSATGVTIGRASGIMSFVRDDSDGSCGISKEWAILPYDAESGAFSAKGDSGAVIVDGLGRIGGLLTGGAGDKTQVDITYATPISFIEKSIKTRYPNAHFNLA